MAARRRQVRVRGADGCRNGARVYTWGLLLMLVYFECHYRSKSLFHGAFPDLASVLSSNDITLQYCFVFCLS